MSILALDFAMLMRNSKTRFGLSLSQEAIIFKLAFRVGSNTSTWISHDSLACECGIHKQNLTAPMQGIVDTGLVKSKQNSKDKRKKIYLFSPLIKNYSQMNDKQKMEVHLAFGDEYQHRDAVIKKPRKKGVDNSENSSGKPERSSQSSSGKPEQCSSGKPERLLEAKTSETLEPQDLQPIQNPPKVTVQNNIKEQSKAPKPALSKNSYCPGTHELIFSEEALRIGKEKNLDMIKTGYAFMDYAKSNGWLRTDWRGAFLKWVRDERSISAPKHVRGTTDTMSEEYKQCLVSPLPSKEIRYAHYANLPRCHIPKYLRNLI